MRRFLALLLFYPVFSSAEWLDGNLFCSQYADASYCGQTAYGKPYKAIATGGKCGDAASNYQHDQMRCQVWVSEEDPDPCPEGASWDQAAYECKSNCGPGLSWNSVSQQCETDAPKCPEGTKEGFKSGPDGKLVESCNPDPMPPQECPEGSSQVGSVTHSDGSVQPICDNQHSCPPGYNPGYVNGEQVCHPDTSNPDCPDGGSYGTFNNTTGCFNPDPNVDNPDYPPNSDPGSPSYPGDDPANPTYPNDPNWPSANNPNYTGGDGGSTSSSSSGGTSFDDSRIVGQLVSLNGKVAQTNSKLDTANESLSGIKDLLDAPEAVAKGGAFDFTVAQSAREAAQAEYGNVIAQIKAEASSMLSVSINGAAGGLTDQVVETKWGEVTFGWGKWSGQLSLIGAIVMALAAVLAAYIILGD